MASRAWASRGSSGSSPTPIAPQGWLVSRPARSPTARRTRYLPVIDLLKALLPDRGPRRRAGDPREGDRQAPDARPRARAALAATPRAARRPVEDAALAARSTRPSAASGPSTRSSACSCARARSSRSWWSSRTCTGSTPRPRRCSTAWSRACPRRALLLLVNYRPEYQHALGQQDLLHASSGSIRCRPRAPRSCSTPCSGDGPGARAAQAAPDRADRGQPVLPGGERANAGRDRGRWSGSAGPIG